MSLQNALQNCKNNHEKHRAETKRTGAVEHVRLLQLSAAGEVFLEGEQPSKSLSADSEILCAHTSGRRSQVGEKSDSFSRAERTRPLRPCVPFEMP